MSRRESRDHLSDEIQKNTQTRVLIIEDRDSLVMHTTHQLYDIGIPCTFYKAKKAPLFQEQILCININCLAMILNKGQVPYYDIVVLPNNVIIWNLIWDLKGVCWITQEVIKNSKKVISINIC